jgi:outer membrane protein W
MKKMLACLAGLTTLPMAAHANSPYFSLQDGDGFKRFSVSVGVLHVMPQGKAQPFSTQTAAKDAEVSQMGDISIEAIKNNLDPAMDPAVSAELIKALDGLGLSTLPGSMSGSARIGGLENYTSPGTGLEADDVTTLGMMTNYFFTDNISLEMKGGFPPKVDLQGKGKIYAPLSAMVTPSIDLLQGIPGGSDLPGISLKSEIPVTDLEAYGPAASARAWTPAFEMQYHFGKTGVNKFRPYVGLGIMYAYYNELEINPRTEQDLIDAGHMIANIKRGQSGAVFDGNPSSADPKVHVEASDAFAPIATIGFTYDFNDTWFAVSSVSYAHLKNDTTITVTDSELGELIRSKADIEVNPILAYAGIGMRF